MGFTGFLLLLLFLNLGVCRHPWPCAYTWRPEEDVRYPTHFIILSLPYSLEAESLTEPELAIFQQNWLGSKLWGSPCPFRLSLEVHAATTICGCWESRFMSSLYSKCFIHLPNSPALYCFKQLIKGAEAMA